MPFSIQILPGPPVRDESGFDYRQGEIRLGSYIETLFIRTAYWSESRYVCQWREALARIVTDSEVSCLITSLEDPRLRSAGSDSDAEFHASEWWPLYRVGSLVYVHNGVIFPHEVTPLFDENDPYKLVPPRRVVNVDGHRLSEWEVSVKEVREFLDDPNSLALDTL